LPNVVRSEKIASLLPLALIAPKSRHCWFTEGFDTRDLKEAKALLDALWS
jgi:hypothetical protein